MDDVVFTWTEAGQSAAPDVDAYVRGQPDASPYHLGAWRAAIADAYGFPSRVLSARQGGAVVGILPVCEVRRPLGRPRWSALPFCDVGGPLAARDALREALAARAAAAAARAGAAGFEMRGWVPGFAAEQTLAGRKVRMLLALPPDADALMQAYPPKLRSQIRKAQKNGLTVAPEPGTAGVAAFHDVYSRNMHRLGSPPHSRAWFEAVVRHFGDDALVMVVRHEGRAIGAGIVLRCGANAAIPWASTLADYNALAPNMLLYWAIQAELCERGVRQFDFGRSTFGEGTYKFKKQWGAQPQALDWREWDRSGAPLVERATDAGGGGRLRPLVEAAWRRLPLGVANAVGARVRRYITL